MSIMGILVAVIFGLVLSMYIRNREMHQDIQQIKAKLGIVEQDDFNMRDEEIEEELMMEMEHGENQQEDNKGKGNNL